MKIKLDLQHFAEGGAGSGGAGGGAPMATGGEGQDAGQEQGQQMMQNQGQQQPSFRELLKDQRYKADAEQWVRETMDQRFRGHKQQMQQLQAQADKTTPIVGLIAQKYGKGAEDLDGILQALEDDDSIYQERADQAGLPVKAFKKLEQLEKENQGYKEQQQKAKQEEAAKAHYQNMLQQEAQLKQQFPGFNLQKELQNPQFLRWTSPQFGMSVKDAFFALHSDEIQKQGMQFAGQQAAQAVAASVRSNAFRPTENAAGANAMAGMRVDVTQMSEEQLDEIDRQSRIKRTTLW
jgi:hypothetical protein